MEIFLGILQGSYAYLLIFQILVVTLLVLSLIGLIVRRIREANGVEEATDSSSAAATITVPGPAVNAAELEELRGKLLTAEEENNKLRAAGADSKSLREKVKYLESKLLEYEILQEEIGTLSQLKIENESLKQELFQVTHTPGSPEPAPTPVAQPIAASPPPAPISPPAVPSPTSILFDAPPGPAPARDSAALAQGEVAATGLESLLQQIDDIAGTSEPK